MSGYIGKVIKPVIARFSKFGQQLMEAASVAEQRQLLEVNSVNEADSKYLLKNLPSGDNAELLNEIKKVDGSGSGIDADKLDGLDSTAFARVDGQSISVVAPINLPVGWYTVAVNSGDRAIARFGIKDIQSGMHQSTLFYASHHFGAHSEITVLHSGRYSGTPIRYIRVKEGGTYDGALLQIYIDNASNSLSFFLLGDNFQSNGWIIKDFVPDGTDPGNVTNFSALTNVAAQVDLYQTLDGGISTTGNIYAGGKTAQYEVWHSGNDGAGSGLDADKLDGLDSTQFLRSDTADSITARLTVNTPDMYSGTDITGMTNAPIYYPEVNVGATSKFLPAFHMRALYQGGYRTHMNVGLYKNTAGWGNGETGFYVGLGGSDYHPTEYFKMTIGGTIKHSNGSIFWNSLNDGLGSGLDADLVRGHTPDTLPAGIGVGQTWQDVTASRSANTTYTNTTGKPIMVIVISGTSYDADIELFINGMQVGFQDINSQAASGGFTVSAIVPHGSSYKAASVNGGVAKWFELR